MPILQWLFKTPSNTCRREQCNIIEEESENSREVVIYGKDKEKERNALTILLNREDNRGCFYSTLQLKRLGDMNFENLKKEKYFARSINLLKMGSKNDNATVGCKVLPVRDMATLGSVRTEKEVQKQRKAVSKMKELIRWAAAANKTGRAGVKGWKVLYFKNKMSMKEPQDDVSSSSSKMSFRSDVGSCSTSSSVFSPLSIASAPSRFLDHKHISNSSVRLQSSNGNSSILENMKVEEGSSSRGAQWITSDSDFVVLEL